MGFRLFATGYIGSDIGLVTRLELALLSAPLAATLAFKSYSSEVELDIMLSPSSVEVGSKPSQGVS